MASTSSRSITEQYLFNVTIVQTVICAIGLVLNAPIIYITLKNKSLRTTYGYFLAICAFLDMLFEFSSLLPMVLMAIRQQISLFVCFFVQWYGTFSNCMVMMLNFFIGVDRLIAVLFPIWYAANSKRHTPRMVSAFTILSFLYALFLVQFMFQYVLSNPQKQVYCQITDIVGGAAIPIGYTATFVLNGMIVGVYLLVGILIRALKNQDELGRRVFRSLAVLISVVFLLWLAQSLVVSVVLPLLRLGSDTEYLVVRLMSQTVRVASAVNTPVLYICSCEYRRILNKEFAFVGRFFSKFLSNTSGVPIAPTTSHITPVQNIARAGGQFQNTSSANNRRMI